LEGFDVGERNIRAAGEGLKIARLAVNQGYVKAATQPFRHDEASLIASASVSHLKVVDTDTTPH
jgi:hypothetical protein